MADSRESRDSELKEAFLRFARLLAGEVKQRDDLRRFVHEAAVWLAAETAEGQQGPAAGSEEPAPQHHGYRVIDSEADAGASAEADSRELIERTLRVGGSHVELRVPRDPSRTISGPTVVAWPQEQPTLEEQVGGWRAATYSDFSVIAGRARLKAEAVRWKAAQRRLEAGLAAEADDPAAAPPPDPQTTYEDLIERAKRLESCYLWMLQSNTLPREPEIRVIAECYENLARVADAAERWARSAEPNTKPPHEMLQLGAEAQSALREALLNAGYQDDRDQNDMFFWLREQADIHSIYIERHLRKSDPADPEGWPDLRARIGGYTQSIESEQQEDKTRAALLNKIEYHVEHLDDPRFDEAAHHWRTIVACLGEWVESGRHPSDPELCERLLPALDEVPEDLELSTAAENALQYTDRLAAARAAREQPASGNGRNGGIAPDLRAAAELLEGKVAVLIGGEVRGYAKRRLERDLHLRELRWLSTRPHQPVADFESAIAANDVALVLLMIRLTSHVHGELAGVCERHGKPFVRLQRGYGSNQVAHEILNQASEKLENAHV